ncbi:MAG: hypothetical protein HZB38_13930 [Planctomycetes bacterium]|nr:hypothetical protein [Planctomycetota bacterium]
MSRANRVLALFLLAFPCLVAPAIADQPPQIERHYLVSDGEAVFVTDATLPGVATGSYAVEPNGSIGIVTINDALRQLVAGSLFIGRSPDAKIPAKFELQFTPDDDAMPVRIIDWTARRRIYSLGGAAQQYDPATETLLIDAPLLSGESAGPLKKAGQLTLRLNLVLESESASGGPADSPAAGEGSQTGRGGPRTAGPDLIVGDVRFLHEYGRVGERLSFAAGTSACNKGDTPVSWYANPNVNHPVMTINMFRLKNDRFEQLGYSWVKHGFGAAQLDLCNLGCTPGCPSTVLCSGCADPYTANQLAEQNILASRNWFNPFTGAFPSSGTNSHTGHAHDELSHRLTLREADIAQDQNGNDTAQYFSEGIYICPHEYLPNNGVANNQHNNPCHRPLAAVGNTGDWYGFATLTDEAIRESPAIDEWTGAVRTVIEPAVGVDGRVLVAYKVTGPVAGWWHYEYAFYNQNLDRSIRLIRIPVGDGAHLTNIDFHAPEHEGGWPGDGTAGNAGLSNAPWSVATSSTAIEWSCETFVANPNANAIRWGTLYNFRFDSDRPPQDVQAVVGYFKTGSDGAVTLAGPQAGPPCVGDMDGDRDVDLNDLTLFLAAFGSPCGPGPCAAGDFDSDGDVDLNDLTLFLAAFGATC